MLTMSRSPAKVPESERPYHHGQLRQALLSAAFELLGTHSPKQLSLREVARHAGVSHAAPYHYFPDKSQLLRALAHQCNVHFYAAQAGAVASQTDARARLLALGEAYVAFALKHPNAFALMFDPEFCPPSAEDLEAIAIIDQQHGLLENIVKEAQTAGTLPKGQPKLVSAALWSTVHGLAQLVLLGHLPKEMVSQILETLIADIDQ